MIRFPDTPEQFYQQTQVCSFGLTEVALPALFTAGADLLGFGAADAAVGAGIGAADVGATAAAAGAGAGIADLAGPTVAGTIFDTLAAPSFDALAGGALAGTGADVLGTAGSALAFPELLGAAGTAGGFGAAADAALTNAASTGLATGTGSIPAANAPIESLLAATPTAGFGTTAVTGAAPSVTGSAPASASLPSNVANANAGASVFDTGTSPLVGTGSGFQPGTAGAASVSAPQGVAGVTDATSAVTGTPAATGATGAASGTPTSSISSLLSKAGGSVADAVTKNPIATALGAAGLGYNIYSGQKQTANEKALAADAATATANSTAATQAGLTQAGTNAATGQNLVNQGEALTQYLTNGTLPPQYMSQIDQAINDAKTNAISNAAAQGQPTDPTKNSSLAATLAGIDNQKAGMITQVASQLFSSGAGLIGTGVGAGETSANSLLSTGASSAGLSGQLYQALVSNDTTQAAGIGKSITSLAAALNGKTQANIGGTTLTVNG